MFADDTRGNRNKNAYIHIVLNNMPTPNLSSACPALKRLTHDFSIQTNNMFTPVLLDLAFPRHYQRLCFINMPFLLRFASPVADKSSTNPFVGSGNESTSTIHRQPQQHRYSLPAYRQCSWPSLFLPTYRCAAFALSADTQLAQNGNNCPTNLGKTC